MNSPTERLDHYRTGPAGEPESFGWRNWFLVFAVGIVACGFQLGAARTLTEHEVWVAGGAKQMAIDHDWIFPKIGDQLWLEKPPLLHWLPIISAKLSGGFSEATVRIPSVLASLGVVGLMTAVAHRWFGRRVAIFTGLIQTTAVYFITYARLAEAEMLLAFFIVMALFVFVHLHAIGVPEPASHPALAVWFWIIVGASNLAKGLGFGPAMILAPCAAYLFWNRDRVGWRRMISWPGLIIGLVIALGWPVAVILLRAPDARALWESTLKLRTLGGMHDEPWWYYLTTPWWQLLPWTPALLLAVAPSIGRARRDLKSPDRFIWCCFLVPIALLTLFHGKHHHYIIASLCLVSPLCALGLLRIRPYAAAAVVALVLAGMLYVHARVLPARDRCRDDVEFLKSVRARVPSNVPLAATGGQEIARAMFYVDPMPQGVFYPSNLDRYFSGKEFYLIARRREESSLKRFGAVEVIAESRHTRDEHNPADRFALFHIEPGRSDR